MNNTIEFTKKIYMFLTYSAYILYITIFLGVWNTAPQYLDDVNYYLKVFIGLVLVITFNPVIKITPSYIHKNISFSAGLLLLTSTTFSAFQQRVSKTVKRVKDEVLE